MNKQGADKLRAHRVELVNNIDSALLTRLLDHMYEKQILLGEDIEIIKSKSTSVDRARALVDVIPTRGPSAFGTFVEALKENNCGWLVDKLSTS